MQLIPLQPHDITEINQREYHVLWGGSIRLNLYEVCNLYKCNCD